TYMQQYDKKATYGSLLKYTWKYSLTILFFWTVLLILWYISDLPLGL
ncbi:AbgT family transporter, partial [Bacteroides heparinolyticus]